MYIENEKWKKLTKEFKELYSNYDYCSDSIRDSLDNIEISIDDIEQNKSNKLYIVTNNAIVDDEISYDIKGFAFTKEEAKKLYEEAINEAKSCIDFDNLDTVNVSDEIELSDEKWHYSKSDNFFELYLEGEYNSNNFTISIEEYYIAKNKDMEYDAVSNINELDDEKANRSNIDMELV